MSYYLKQARIKAFGSVTDSTIGPFAAGLNVVYGPNEAGKTTTSAFIEGVLFGWRSARSFDNTYRPDNAERSGTLLFAHRATADEDMAASRTRNVDGITPPSAQKLVEDIDRETYETMFALNSSQLMGLDGTSDVTTRLLTAGVGTNNAPAQALAVIDAKMREITSSSAAYPYSIPSLKAEAEQVGNRIAVAEQQATDFKSRRRELERLEPLQKQVAADLMKVNVEIECLVKNTEAIERLNDEQDRLHRERTELRRALQEVVSDASPQVEDDIPQIDALQEGMIRDTLDDFERRSMQLESACMVAEQTYRASSAVCEAAEVDGKGTFTRRAPQLFITIAVCVLALAGAGLCLANLLVSGDATSVPGLAFLVASAVVGVVSIVVRAVLSGQETGSSSQVVRNALLQDRAKWDSVRNNRDQLNEQISDYLQQKGLGSADGNIRAALGLLDAAHTRRQNQRQALQQQSDLRQRLQALQDSIDANEEACRRAMQVTAATDVERGVLLKSATERRESLQQTLEQTSHRVGELRTELAGAAEAKQLDALKLQREMLRTRTDDVVCDFVRLQLARKTLTDAMTAWESDSQPQVYVRAGEIFRLMTGGTWKQVRPTEDGDVVVIDAFGQLRSAALLSTGTCQQLYLSLRIALLTTADDVGRNVPVLADDILVNFDAERRRAAARALVQLADSRQVIMFTCHEEVVRLMQEACDHLNLVSL